MDASDEVPAGSQITLVSVSGRAFTPKKKALITVTGGSTIARAFVPVLADGSFVWNDFMHPQVPIGTTLTAVASDTAGLNATTTAVVVP